MYVLSLASAQVGDGGDHDGDQGEHGAGDDRERDRLVRCGDEQIDEEAGDQLAGDRAQTEDEDPDL